MNELDRRQHADSTRLLMQILERPGVVAAVRELPGPVLGRLIDRIGLEDAGELVALASTAQLERVFDDDLWRAARAGGDESFRPERFVLWLRVMLEAGEDALVRRLCELPRELVALAVHRLVLVVDLDVLEEQLSPGDEEAQALERALENAAFEEWEEFRVIARDGDAWDDVWGALMALDRDHHDRLRDILEQCCAMTLEYISGQGGLYQVLTASEMLESDVAASREDRRAAEGFVSPADARAFLALAKRPAQDGGRAPEPETRDPITRAYFRDLPRAETPSREKVPSPSSPGKSTSTSPARAAADETRELLALLAAAEQPEVAGFEAPPLGRLASLPGTSPARTHLVAPLFEQAMKDLRQQHPARFDERVQEVGYLVNVWMAGGAHEGRRPDPAEAMQKVLEVCEAGLRDALSLSASVGRDESEEARTLLARTPADVLFRRGFRDR